jgi:inorganic pyrophosphatase
MKFHKVFVEIEKHSNHKYEWDHDAGVLVLDRVLPYPYFYPYSYGFIPDTMAPDGDEVDVLILSDRCYKKTADVECFIIGALEMEDEKGEDLKLLALSSEDFYASTARDVADLPPKIRDDIRWFFTNYKSHDESRWSKTGRFLSREEALRELDKCAIP